MYNTQNFATRFQLLGDTSETAFEAYSAEHGIAIARYGFNRPPITKFAYLNAFIRYTPDYLAQYDKKLFFCEVKGTSKNHVKIKLKQLDQLVEWHKLEPVVFYIYNSAQKQSTFINLAETLSVIATHNIMIQRFTNDQNEFYEIPLTWDIPISQVL